MLPGYFCTWYTCSPSAVFRRERGVDQQNARAAQGTQAEVIVVGAGPTGLTLACELALAGVDTVVLERLPRRMDRIKGGTLQPRTAELLELRGLLEPLARRALPREPVGGHFGMLPVPLDCTPFGTRHPHPLSVPQGIVEEVLEERARTLGARILRGHPVTGVRQDADGATAHAEPHGPVRGRYLVACDGGRSAVRKALGLPFPGRDGTYLAVLADVRLASVSATVPRQAGHISGLTRSAGGYWAMLLPAGGDRYRLTFGQAHAAGGPAGDRDAPVTEAEIAAALRAVYGQQTVLAAVENASRFSDATRQLTRYREGRVLFAGDAAHIHPPLGGQGLNLGVQDAFNLGWKLAATLRGRAPRGLLDTYHAERHPVAAAVLHHTAAQRVLAAPEPDGDVAALRDLLGDLLRLPEANRHLAGLMSGLSLRYDLPGRHPLTGGRVPDPELRTSRGPARLSSLLTGGRAALLDLCGRLDPGPALPAHTDLIRAAPHPAIPATALLLRPDGYVAWATDDPAPRLPRALRPADAPGGARGPGGPGARPVREPAPGGA
ncbi:FAD-dependent monooxygenase [Streptomyces hoynatensis]|uniref:Monooxygenase n=1 Tax=Streptomyces hoynatensis TaxID=1141874 RepID=A0A3A9YLJ5_9ACTN|nr:FAD-dependent monooxygenase [Streptomyces hoynatensis]RKN37182.1 monooxygenase [Streptomyces hoynatensis]